MLNTGKGKKHGTYDGIRCIRIRRRETRIIAGRSSNLAPNCRQTDTSPGGGRWVANRTKSGAVIKRRTSREPAVECPHGKSTVAAGRAPRSSWTPRKSLRHGTIKRE